MKITKILTYTVLTLLAAIFIVPFIWLIVESFSPVSDLGFVIPSHFTLAPFYKVLTNHEFINSIYEGLIQSFGGTLISVMFSIGPAYIFSRKKFKLRLYLLLSILFLTGFPVFSLLIPHKLNS